MLVSSLSYLLMPERISIYIKQVARRMDSPAHLGDFVVDLLDRMLVKEVMTRFENNPELIRFNERESLGSIFEKVSQSSQTAFPVVDAQRVVTGHVSTTFVRPLCSPNFSASLSPRTWPRRSLSLLCPPTA